MQMLTFVPYPNQILHPLRDGAYSINSRMEYSLVKESQSEYAEIQFVVAGIFSRA